MFISWLLLVHPDFFINAAAVTPITPGMAAEIVRAGKFAYFTTALPLEVRKLAGLKPT